MQNTCGIIISGVNKFLDFIVNHLWHLYRLDFTYIRAAVMSKSLIQPVRRLKKLFFCTYKQCHFKKNSNLWKSVLAVAPLKRPIFVNSVTFYVFTLFFNNLLWLCSKTYDLCIKNFEFPSYILINTRKL